MTAEEIVGQILSLCPEVSREQIWERLAVEKRKTGGLISDDTLLKIISAEFGCEIAGDETSMPALSLTGMIPGLANVTAVGRIVAVFSPRAFKGNRSGKFASLLIADGSGILRIVLWNSKTALIESGELKVGEIVRFSHGYTREDYGEKVEFHVGEKCKIEINPQGEAARDYPTVSKFNIRIGELTHAHRSKRVNAKGTVTRVFSTSTFERQDSSPGKVMRFALVDESGEISVVVWNEKVDELEAILRIGTNLQVVNAKLKKAMKEGLEIHVDATTYVEVTSQNEFLKIGDLKEGFGEINVEGEVASRPVVRNIKTSKGENVKLAVFELRDETGKMWVSAWRKHADSAANLEVGKKIVLEKAYVRKGFGEQLEISTKDATSMIITE